MGKDLRYYIIGPWVEIRADADEIDRLAIKQIIPHHLRAELIQYLNEVPLVNNFENWEVTLQIFAEAVYGGEDQFRLSHEDFNLNGLTEVSSSNPEKMLSMHILEERYRTLDTMLEAIGRGDTKQALKCLVQHGKYKLPPLSPDEFRNNKIHLIHLNAFAMKSVERNCVHPAHIDAVFSDFARRIEEVSSLQDMRHLCETLISCYCELVQKHSLRNYSALIRKAINIIDFNFAEALSLRLIAKQCNVNASYLSAQFKREKNMTITDYINTKRMQLAHSLLRDSGRYVQQVAEDCGFLDVNYFTRLFKRQYGQTPREYQSSAGGNSLS
jgi:AraC-like DNA-binding protein